jgi:hypothetical protein
MAKTKPKGGKPRKGADKASAPAATVAAWRQVNRVQLSELLGVHPDTVTDYARDGMPVTTRGGQGKEGVYDAVLCLEWWREQQGKNAKEAAQTRAYEATAALNEQRLAERRKELVTREAVLLAGQAYTKAWVAKIRALPRRLVESGLIGREQEPQAATLLRDVLTDIAGWKTVADAKRVTGAKKKRGKTA